MRHLTGPLHRPGRAQPAGPRKGERLLPRHRQPQPAVLPSLQTFRREGLIDEGGCPTEKALQLAADNRSERAVILAAGFGMRMIPMNAEIPKGMLTVHGEVLIERLIRQLHEAGVHEIWVVTGYRKEQYEYLADTFGVKLLFCRDYMTSTPSSPRRIIWRTPISSPATSISTETPSIPASSIPGTCSAANRSPVPSSGSIAAARFSAWTGTRIRSATGSLALPISGRKTPPPCGTVWPLPPPTAATPGPSGSLP